MKSKSGQKPIRKGSSKRPRKHTSGSQASLRRNTSKHSDPRPLQEAYPSLKDLLLEANPQGEDVRTAVASGMASLAIIADILESGLPVYPLTVRQANALVVELEHEWIRDKENVGELIKMLRDWLATLSNGS